ncbi:sucrase ferredoxin [Nitriliruptoraceae bacterium ZYF776]|nr:sucrase ferredoxin [Profundirhabdus halotolerans]
MRRRRGTPRGRRGRYRRVAGPVNPHPARPCAPTPGAPRRAAVGSGARYPELAVPAAVQTPSCAALAREHDAQLAGTAPVAAGWLLVEQPGPWGRKALHESGLDPAIGGPLDRAAKAAGVRAQAIRRPGRGARSASPGRGARSASPGRGARSASPGRAGPGPFTERTVVLAHTGATPWAEVLTVADDRELAALDPTLPRHPTPPGLGPLAPGPLWLVCTHGKRDRCCAELGRPLADALALVHGDAVWEVSHIGGHRFAGNLLTLPDGLVHGNLDVAGALAVVDRHRAGRLDVARLRGRSGLPRPAQAAEVLVRDHLGVDALDAVTDLEVVARDDGRELTARLTVAGTRYAARLEHRDTGTSYRMACDNDDLEDPGRFTLVALERS